MFQLRKLPPKGETTNRKLSALGLAFFFALIRLRFEAFDFLELAGGFLPSP